MLASFAAATTRARTSVVVAGAAAVGLLVAGAVVGALSWAAASGPSIQGLRSWDLSPSHVTTPVDYAQTPPVGGPHAPQWLNCGVYTAPVPDENAVHSLEHGAVWVTYRPDLPADQVARLAPQLPDTYVILSPYAGLTPPIVASAWGVQVALDGVDDPRLLEFVRAYRQGPQTLEPGAPCHAGTDAGVPTASPPPTSP